MIKDVAPPIALRREGLGDQVSAQLLEAVIDGTYPPGSRLPTEAQLAEMAGVSRLTIREAVRSLRNKGVLSVEQGRGTFVTKVEEWSPLDPALLAARSAVDPDPSVARDLTEARRVVEAEVAGLAAQRRTEEHLRSMEAALELMRSAESDTGAQAFADADIAFHDAVMSAAGNPVLAAMFQPLTGLIHQVRERTSRSPASRERAIAEHRRIYEALRDRRHADAREAMSRHLQSAEQRVG